MAGHHIRAGPFPLGWIPALLLHLLWPWIIAIVPVAAATARPSSVIAEPPITTSASTGLRHVFSCQAMTNFFQDLLSYIKLDDHNIRIMVQITAVCGLIPGVWLVSRKLRSDIKQSDDESRDEDRVSRRTRATRVARLIRSRKNDAASTDPGLLRKHSSYHSYTIPIHGFTYPSIRVFYRPHPQADKLPTKPKPIPLLVFIHGLGGSLAQFHALMISLVNTAPCLGIDLPGCGLSGFKPRSWDAYSIDALVELLDTVIEDYRDKEAGQDVVLIGHSLGCSLAALLASPSASRSSKVLEHVIGLVAICPRATPPTAAEVSTFRKLLHIPGPIFDLWRMWDKRGGTESASVKRFVGPNADKTTKELQVRFNSQSKTPVWRRMAWGSLPVYKNPGEATGGMPGRSIWSGLQVPVFAVAGEADNVTKPKEVETIAEYMGKDILYVGEDGESSPLPTAAGPIDPQRSQDSQANDKPRHSSNATSTDTRKTLVNDPQNTTLDISSTEPPDPTAAAPRKPQRILKTTVIPSPAAHALLYQTVITRTLAGLIATFLETYIDPRLSLGWQLQHLSTEGKWDVKNLAKWQAVNPVSTPISGIFRALKTLREVDERHCPAVFVKEWSSKIGHVIDISHESPVYDPKGLEQGGIQYHKFPSVSKIPPTAEEVSEFIDLVDRLREEMPPSDLPPAERPLIGVHCHYGYNRTGFFICSYLVEREGYGVQEAIDEFEKHRPPGIRHEHFIDTLFVRYTVGLKKPS